MTPHSAASRFHRRVSDYDPFYSHVLITGGGENISVLAEKNKLKQHTIFVPLLFFYKNTFYKNIEAQI